jgi:hypothetical protein
VLPVVGAGFVLQVTRITEVEEEVEIRRWKVETRQVAESSFGTYQEISTM